MPPPSCWKPRWSRRSTTAHRPPRSRRPEWRSPAGSASTMRWRRPSICSATCMAEPASNASRSIMPSPRAWAAVRSAKRGWRKPSARKSRRWPKRVGGMCPASGTAFIPAIRVRPACATASGGVAAALGARPLFSAGMHRGAGEPRSNPSGKETPAPPRRDLLRSAALVPAAALPLPLASIDAALAQAVDLLKLFVPAAPGGGWDQTARTIEQVLRATGAVKGVQITNVGGAGGAVGLPQFLNQWKGQGNALMVAGMVMVGAITANKSPVKLAQATPIARLTGEFLALVVPAPSPFTSAKDFAAALKADPAKVPVAGGSARGSDHIPN